MLNEDVASAVYTPSLNTHKYQEKQGVTTDGWLVAWQMLQDMKKTLLPLLFSLTSETSRGGLKIHHCWVEEMLCKCTTIHKHTRRVHTLTRNQTMMHLKMYFSNQESMSQICQGTGFSKSVSTDIKPPELWIKLLSGTNLFTACRKQCFRYKNMLCLFHKSVVIIFL